MAISPTQCKGLTAAEKAVVERLEPRIDEFLNENHPDKETLEYDVRDHEGVNMDKVVNTLVATYQANGWDVEAEGLKLKFTPSEIEQAAAEQPITNFGKPE